MKDDKRGIALIYVIVTISVILLLGSTTVTISYANLKRSQLQLHSDENIYNASSVLNSLTSEIMELASEAYNNAYIETIGEITTSDTNNTIRNKCKEKYVSELKKIFRDTEDEIAPDTHYSISLLNKLADKAYDSDELIYEGPDGNRHDDLSQNDIAQNITYQKVQYVITTEGKTQKNLMEATSDAFVLKNVHVHFESNDGYIDDIVTDIHINTKILDVNQYPVINS